MNMYKIIYNKVNGSIVAIIPLEQPLEAFVYHYPKETKNKLDFIVANIEIYDLENYKVVSENLVRKTDQEIQETEQYGKTLTKEERLLNKLKPSYEEVKKAENTIEILTLIQEVI